MSWPGMTRGCGAGSSCRCVTHLPDSHTLDAAILGGYVAHVMKLPPGAPLPAVYRDELIADARDLRAREGDDRFIALLPSGDADEGAAWKHQRARPGVQRADRPQGAATAEWRPCRGQGEGGGGGSSGGGVRGGVPRRGRRRAGEGGRAGRGRPITG